MCVSVHVLTPCTSHYPSLCANTLITPRQSLTRMAFCVIRYFVTTGASLEEEKGFLWNEHDSQTSCISCCMPECNPFPSHKDSYSRHKPGVIGVGRWELVEVMLPGDTMQVCCKLASPAELSGTCLQLKELGQHRPERIFAHYSNRKLAHANSLCQNLTQTDCMSGLLANDTPLAPHLFVFIWVLLGGTVWY